MTRETNELKIHCTNHREGCGWVGKLGDLKGHLDSDKGCGYVEVTCTNKGCKKRMMRNKLPHHLQQKCYYRLHECEYCGHRDTYWMITGKISKGITIEPHYLECPEYSQACPNKCGVVDIRGRAIPRHKSSCPLEPLNCPFKDAGCIEKVVRKEMEEHMTANQQKHMLLTFQSLQRSTNEDSHVTKHELRATKQELRATKQELNEAKLELHAIKQEMHTTKQALLATIQELQATKQEQHATKQATKRAIKQATKQELHAIKQELQEIKQHMHESKKEIHNTKQELQIVTVGLGTIGDTLTFRVTGFPQLWVEKKVWHSLPFSIGDKVRVQL